MKNIYHWLFVYQVTESEMTQFVIIIFAILIPIVAFLIYRDCKKTEKNINDYYDNNPYPSSFKTSDGYMVYIHTSHQQKKVICGDRVYVQCPNGQFMRNDWWETAEIYGIAEEHWFVDLPQDEIEWIPQGGGSVKPTEERRKD